MLVEEGYSALTFDRVGEVSGYSRGLASQKFGSKDGMMLAVVTFLNNRLNARYIADTEAAADPLDEIIIAPLSLSYFVLLATTVANTSSINPPLLKPMTR